MLSFGAHAWADQADNNMQAAIEKFEHDGFGMSSLLKDEQTLTATAHGVKQSANMLDCLTPQAKDAALVYLRFPSRGIWQSTRVDTAYKKFVSNSDDDRDHACACYDFIKATYAFGQAKYPDCINQLAS